jgi:hypothetical protein
LPIPATTGRPQAVEIDQRQQPVDNNKPLQMPQGDIRPVPRASEQNSGRQSGKIGVIDDERLQVCCCVLLGGGQAAGVGAAGRKCFYIGGMSAYQVRVCVSVSLRSMYTHTTAQSGSAFCFVRPMPTRARTLAPAQVPRLTHTRGRLYMYVCVGFTQKDAPVCASSARV